MKSIAALILVLSLSLSPSLSLHAQYYYNDIIGTKETNKKIKLYRDHRVLLVSSVGYDAEGVRTNDFIEKEEVSPTFIKYSRTNNSAASSQYFYFNDAGLTKIVDSSGPVTATTSYVYDQKNQLVAIRNMVSDPEDSIYQSEQHLWSYDANGTPQKMLRVVNDRDTTEIRFTSENGNVIEEQIFKRGRAGEKIYYYYDANNRLTDIVRYNSKAKRLLPDMMFEYSPTNLVAQKITTTTMPGVGYIIWRYVYDEKGLKTKEASFNRNKAMIGKIEYNYRFGQ